MNHVDITQVYIALSNFEIKLKEGLYVPQPWPNHDPDPNPDPHPDTPSLYNSQSNCVYE